MSRVILATRMVAAAILVIAAVLTTSTLDAGYEVKGPMLTLIGGVIVLVGLVPARLEWENLIVTVGTGTAVGGSFYWYLDAAESDAWSLAAVILVSVTLVGTALFFVVIAWLVSRREPDEIDRNRKAVVRRLRRRLHEVVDETQHARSRGTDGVLYEQFDHVIFGLFLNTWSMANDRSLWTYAPKEHENLIDSYVVERLRSTAEIAISKHPHQCKYGAVAYNLSDYAGLYLYRVMIITEFDPLPAECPHCREPKPTHKANCMAAICWQCKYPTPPRNPDSQNAEVITPQCHIPALCHPRGELVTPREPIAVRIKLGFTLPKDGEDQCLIDWNWPRDRRDLRNLFEMLQHD